MGALIFNRPKQKIYKIIYTYPLILAILLFSIALYELVLEMIVGFVIILFLSFLLIALFIKCINDEISYFKIYEKGITKPKIFGTEQFFHTQNISEYTVSMYPKSSILNYITVHTKQKEELVYYQSKSDPIDSLSHLKIFLHQNRIPYIKLKKWKNN